MRHPDIALGLLEHATLPGASDRAEGRGARWKGLIRAFASVAAVRHTLGHGSTGAPFLSCPAGLRPWSTVRRTRRSGSAGSRAQSRGPIHFGFFDTGSEPGAGGPGSPTSSAASFQKLEQLGILGVFLLRPSDCLIVPLPRTLLFHPFSRGPWPGKTDHRRSHLNSTIAASCFPRSESVRPRFLAAQRSSGLWRSSSRSTAIAASVAASASCMRPRRRRARRRHRKWRPLPGRIRVNSWSPASDLTEKLDANRPFSGRRQLGGIGVDHARLRGAKGGVRTENAWHWPDAVGKRCKHLARMCEHTALGEVGGVRVGALMPAARAEVSLLRLAADRAGQVASIGHELRLCRRC